MDRVLSRQRMVDEIGRRFAPLEGGVEGRFGRRRGIEPVVEGDDIAGHPPLGLVRGETTGR